MRVLIFGTAHVDSIEKQFLIEHWDALHASRNPDCNTMLIDHGTITEPLDNSAVYCFTDNIGHLSRGGRDGWGRAFCFGVQFAIDNDYDYVVHVEGDSLCKLDVMQQCREMQRDQVAVRSVPVRGTKTQEKDWVETGLMFMDVRYMQVSDFVETYNWQDGDHKKYPRCPEWWVRQIIGQHLQLMHDWKTIRDDKGVLNENSVVDYDWITHSKTAIYDAFMSAANV